MNFIITSKALPKHTFVSIILLNALLSSKPESQQSSVSISKKSKTETLLKISCSDEKNKVVMMWSQKENRQQWPQTLDTELWDIKYPFI